MKVAGWSEAHYVDLMPHNPLGPICTAATIHFSAAVPNFFAGSRPAPTPPTSTPDFDNADSFPQQPRLDGAVYPVPRRCPGSASRSTKPSSPGESFRFWEAPHLTRRDGSVTNW